MENAVNHLTPIKEPCHLGGGGVHPMMAYFDDDGFVLWFIHIWKPVHLQQ